MRGKAGPRVAKKLAWRIAWGCALILVSGLCGCSWIDVFPAHPITISNADAVDRALKLCSLSAGEQPFHLVFEVTPDQDAHPLPIRDLRAQIEVFWLNPITYRTVIRSRDFTQTRIVNGSVVEEHNTGDFYPRWIQNFVEAILEPIPGASALSKAPGSVPIGLQEHGCVSGGSAQVCFEDAEPRIATGSDPSRSIWFDDYAPFGRQQIARTLVDKLPGNLLIHGHIVLIAPLRQSDDPLLKAKEFTLKDKLIQTEFVSRSTAESLMQIDPPDFADRSRAGAWKKSQTRQSAPAAQRNALDTPAMVYIRTDRTGKVREAYAEGSEEDAAAVRALALRFKPLMVGGAPRQMEAEISVP
jgi:hypothetical protein